MPLKLAIVGGGPGGLSLAYQLRKERNLEITVFEAEARVGGKSFTYERSGHMFEMGTCYATRGDRLVRKWMKEVGIQRKRLGSATFEGTEFYTYAKKAPGPSLPVQGLRYLRARAKLLSRLDKNLEDQEALEEAAMPLSEWLRARSLYKMERLFYRGMTTMGYGQPSETATIQGLRWVDRPLILSGMLNDLVMPKEGWSEFWLRISRNLNVRVGHRITSVRRDSHGVDIKWDNGQERFDFVVCAIPLDEFVALCDQKTSNEQAVCHGIKWGGFVTTLAVVDDWFSQESARSFAGGILPDAMPGRLLSARFEADEPELGGALYMLNQLEGSFDAAELTEIARLDTEKDGGKLKSVVYQKIWKYHAHYNRDAIRNGLLGRLRDMQGDMRSFYTGAAFSHEAVSKITQFNQRLARQLARIANSVSEH
jgi:hypothetical protein